MTNDEIQKIANEVWAAGTVYIGPSIDSLAQFASLVAADAEKREKWANEALERCKVVCNATSEGWREDTEQWESERDELLEALRLALHQNEHDMVMTAEECRQCRAAITKAEAWK